MSKRRHGRDRRQEAGARDACGRHQDCGRRSRDGPGSQRHPPAGHEQKWHTISQDRGTAVSPGKAGNLSLKILVPNHRVVPKARTAQPAPQIPKGLPSPAKAATTPPAVQSTNGIPLPPPPPGMQSPGFRWSPKLLRRSPACRSPRGLRSPRCWRRRPPARAFMRMPGGDGVSVLLTHYLNKNMPAVPPAAAPNAARVFGMLALLHFYLIGLAAGDAGDVEGQEGHRR